MSNYSSELLDWNVGLIIRRTTYNPFTLRLARESYTQAKKKKIHLALCARKLQARKKSKR